EYVGRSITDFHVDPPVIEDILARLRRGETLLDYEARLRHSDGSVRHVLIHSNVLWEEDRFLYTRCFTRDITDRKRSDQRIRSRDRFLIGLDDAVRPLTQADAIMRTAAGALGRHLAVNRCAYAAVEDDQDTFELTGDYNDGVQSIVGRYTFTQFSEECLRLMRAGEPYVVTDAQRDPRISPADYDAYALTEIRAVVCVPILKGDRFVAAMSVHAREQRAWLADEIELVQQVASRCWESIERARISKSLLDSEQRFRTLANSIANLAWMAKPDGWIYWYNDQWYTYTGTAPADMAGWGWESVHDPAILPEVKRLWTYSIAMGSPFEMVFPIRGADGTFRRFLTRVNPVRNAAGEVIHWFGTNTDVESERRATEINEILRRREQLARADAELQKQLLHSLFMQAPMLICVLRGPDHVIELANPPICEAWGHSRDSLINRSLFDAMPELRGQGFQALLDQVYQSGVAQIGTETPTRFVRDRGVVETVYFNFIYSPFRNIEGAIEGIFVIASDVTAQVLARNQVNDLREAAESANRAKDEFLAMLGHELRNPLSPILTALHLMRLRGSDDSLHERTIIERQVRHLTRLVDDLLDVSRIARGKVELRQEVLEIATVVARAIEMSSPLLDQGMHVLAVDVPRQGLTVEGDPTRLSQVVSNLLTNAAKYTPAGGEITIAAVEDNDDVVLSVRDNGIGIAADVLPRVFDLFIQDRQDIARSQGGLGLGLAIVRNLVERHGGSVVAQSEGPGLGSAFTVRLRRVEPRAPSADVHAPPSVELSPTLTVGATRVLVVDDSEDGALTLSAALAARGYQTQVAHDAPNALRIAADFMPTVALLDLGLPVMDGYQLAARLRGLPGLEAIRLVAVTGYGQEADYKKTAAAGFNRHLVKPVDVASIEAALA
ncbi:MAG: ATP-binding protein, partial [Vicinamibacterales bacterium]